MGEDLMGSWGYEIDESDSFLDIMDSCLDFVIEGIDEFNADNFIVKISNPRELGELTNNFDDFISYGFILYHMCSDKKLYYFNSKNALVGWCSKMERVLPHADKCFQCFHDSNSRKRCVEELYNQIKALTQKEATHTTLIDKMTQSAENQEEEQEEVAV